MLTSIVRIWQILGATNLPGNEINFDWSLCQAPICQTPTVDLRHKRHCGRSFSLDDFVLRFPGRTFTMVST